MVKLKNSSLLQTGSNRMSSKVERSKVERQEQPWLWSQGLGAKHKTGDMLPYTTKLEQQNVDLEPMPPRHRRSSVLRGGGATSGQLLRQIGAINKILSPFKAVPARSKTPPRAPSNPTFIQNSREDLKINS